jgi:hypothetical protein
MLANHCGAIGHRAARRSCRSDIAIFLGDFGRKSAAGRQAFRRSALASLEAALRFIDDIDAPLAPHETVVPVTAAKRFQ